MNYQKENREQLVMKITPELLEKAKESTSSGHGWCEITPLGGDFQDNIFMATFTDDYRFIFEVDNEEIVVMQTRDQEERTNELTIEENESTIYEIMVFFCRWREENAKCQGS